MNALRNEVGEFDFAKKALYAKAKILITACQQVNSNRPRKYLLANAMAFRDELNGVEVTDYATGSWRGGRPTKHSLFCGCFFTLGPMSAISQKLRDV